MLKYYYVLFKHTSLSSASVYTRVIIITRVFAIHHHNLEPFHEFPSPPSLSVQFSSVAQSRLTLCDPIDGSTPGFPVQHQLLEVAQTHVHRVGVANQPSHPLSSPSPPAPNPSQHQGLFQRVNSSHEVAKVLEFHLQHQSFQ